MAFQLTTRIFKMIRKLAFKFIGSPLELGGLVGDRCIEYAFVIKSLVNLDKTTYQKVLDVGCFASPLTTAIKEIGFIVDGIDLMPTICAYEGVNYIKNDFLLADFKESYYDAVVFCSTIEHVGLGGRYGSPSVEDGDIRSIKKACRILRPNGILIMTLPYGPIRIIKPFHRIYNKESALMKYARNAFETVTEEFYKKNQSNVWCKCSENEARAVIPSSDSYALGLFVFKKK